MGDSHAFNLALLGEGKCMDEGEGSWKDDGMCVHDFDP